MMFLQLLLPLSKGGVVEPALCGRLQPTSLLHRTPRPTAKMTAGLCFYQSLAFESFLGSGVFCEAAL